MGRKFSLIHLDPKCLESCSEQFDEFNHLFQKSMLISKKKAEPLNSTSVFPMFYRILLATYSEDTWDNWKFIYKLWIFYRKSDVAFIPLLE